MKSNILTCIGCGKKMTDKGTPRIDGLRERQAKGRCTLCYQKGLKSGELLARPRVRTTSSEIECSRCLRWKPRGEFKVRGSNVCGYHHVCRFCDKLFERYKLTFERYREMYLDQGGLCAICGKQLIEFDSGTTIDHDHYCCSGGNSCGVCVRGLLCTLCNTGLGMFKDNEQSLIRAIDYIAKSNISRYTDLEKN